MLGKISKKIIFFAILGVIGLFIVYLLLNVFYYVDIVRFCFINIDEDILNGNPVTIKKALLFIKKDSPDSYSDACRYVDMVTENYCIAGDVEPHSEAAWSKKNEPGCYIRGSKTIYIKPEKEENEIIIRARAEAIEKLAQKSKKFWQEKQ